MMTSPFFLAEETADAHAGDPENAVDQIKYAADFLLRYLGKARSYLGLGGTLDVVAAINDGTSGVPRRLWDAWFMLSVIDDPDIKRMHAVLASYKAHANAKSPFGYFACVVICNRTAGMADWSKDPRPWGFPDP